MKKYVGRYPEGSFKIGISQIPHNFFVATIVYFSKEESFSTDTNVVLNAELEHFFARTESDAYYQCLTWIEENISDKYKIDDDN